MSLQVPPPDKEPMEHARRAVSHVLKRIRDDANVGYHLGLGTQTFYELVQAHAALSGLPVEKVQESFTPRGREEDLNIQRYDLREVAEETEEELRNLVASGAPWIHAPVDVLNKVRKLLGMRPLEVAGRELVESEVGA